MVKNSIYSAATMNSTDTSPTAKEDSVDGLENPNPEAFFRHKNLIQNTKNVTGILDTCHQINIDLKLHQ